MPEGPTIVILKEEVQQFIGKTVIAATGNTKKLDTGMLNGQTIVDFKSWGKHFLICFDNFTVRVHFMLFGSYRVNENKETPARLHLQFENGELNFYACSLKLIEQPLDEVYDWGADIMNPGFDKAKAMQRLLQHPQMLACDALLDQHIFSGSGNIIKNEVLFRIRMHPQSLTGKMPAEKLNELIDETVNYSFDFLKWKKEYTLKKHWLAHTKTICPRDHVPFHKAYLGKTKRRTFYCDVCQVSY
jgi:endonuclease VIII